MLQIYGALGCSRCEQVKSLLTKKGIAFEYKIVDETNMSILREAKSKGFTSMPVLVQDGEIVDLENILN